MCSALTGLAACLRGCLLAWKVGGLERSLPACGALCRRGRPPPSPQPPVCPPPTAAPLPPARPTSPPPQDLADSKRVNANVHSVPNTATPLRRRRALVGIDPLSATIVSQLFWPQLAQEEFTLPPEVRRAARQGGAGGAGAGARAPQPRTALSAAALSNTHPDLPTCPPACTRSRSLSHPPTQPCPPLLPPQVSAMLATYAAKYRSLKAPRKLVWRPSLGTVQLELAIGEQRLEFNVRGRAVGRGACGGWGGCGGVGGLGGSAGVARGTHPRASTPHHPVGPTPAPAAPAPSPLPRRCPPSTPRCCSASSSAPSGPPPSWPTRWGWRPTRCAARPPSGSTRVRPCWGRCGGGGGGGRVGAHEGSRWQWRPLNTGSSIAATHAHAAHTHRRAEREPRAGRRRPGLPPQRAAAERARGAARRRRWHGAGGGRGGRGGAGGGGRGGAGLAARRGAAASGVPQLQLTAAAAQCPPGLAGACTRPRAQPSTHPFHPLPSATRLPCPYPPPHPPIHPLPRRRWAPTSPSSWAC